MTPMQPLSLLHSLLQVTRALFALENLYTSSMHMCTSVCQKQCMGVHFTNETGIQYLDKCEGVHVLNVMRITQHTYKEKPSTQVKPIDHNSVQKWH